VDRRFSQTLPRLDIDPFLRDQILGVWMDSQPPEGKNKALHRTAHTRSYILTPATKSGEDSEDKAIARLGVNYGVLRRLGFREDQVEECLRTTHGMDLEDMFDWVNDAIFVFFILKFTCFSAIPAFS